LIVTSYLQRYSSWAIRFADITRAAGFCLPFALARIRSCFTVSLLILSKEKEARTYDGWASVCVGGVRHHPKEVQRRVALFTDVMRSQGATTGPAAVRAARQAVH
jgi:hypothetical protein